MPKVAIEFLLERHPKELTLISFFGHTELWDDGMQKEFEAWQEERCNRNGQMDSDRRHS